MRKIGMKVVLLMLSLGVLLSSFALQAKAQDEGEKATQVYIVPIKNVRAEVMAYWITPRKTISPKSQKLDEKSFTEVSSLGDIPGLESITANSAKNELWVKGTPDSVGKLKEIVAFLDRPIRKVEIKAQFVEVDAAEMAGLGIEENVEGKVNTASFGKNNKITFGQSFRDKLRTLIESKRADVVQFVQISATNNLTSTVNWSDYPMLPPTGLQITPTIQNDDTVTVFLSPPFNRSTASFDKTANEFSTVVANVKASDVIVLQTKQTSPNKRAVLLLVSAQTISDQTALLD